MKSVSNNLGVLNLKGEVRCLVEYTYKAGSELGQLFRETKWIAKTEIIFTKEGNIVEDKMYNYGNLESEIKINYDQTGKPLEENNYSLNGIIKRVYKYNNKGSKIEERVFSNNELYRKVTYKYDKIGGVTKEDKEYSKGRILIKKIIKYNSKGDEIEYWCFDKSLGETLYNHFVYPVTNEKQKEITYKYDKEGNIIEEEYFVSNVKKTCRFKNTEKEITEIEYLDGGDMISHISICKFDIEGNITSEYSDFPLNAKNHGYYLLTDSTDYKYNYNFDKYGNWVKKIKFEDDRPIFIFEREIEYF